MKSLIVYSTQTGNTKKLADTVYEQIKGEKEIRSVESAPDPAGYDFLAVGFWVKAGKPDPETMNYIPRITSGKKIFFFATHGASTDSDHVKEAIEYAKNLAPSADILGTFNCLGEVDPAFVKRMSEKEQQPVWLHNAPNAVGHPDSTDLKNLINILSSFKFSL
ncbi:MAG: flavodoxin family protein [Spirochaetes bacterium]|nr:flavodoxin family protein [Spirochaetota bacterium]